MTGYQLLFLLILIVFAAIALFLFLPATGSRRRDGASPDDDTPGAIYRGDDRRWLGGLVYYNPDDSDSFVPKRRGWGWTVNFGHLGGTLFMIAILILALLPVLLAIAGVHLPSYGCHPSGCHGLP